MTLSKGCPKRTPLPIILEDFLPERFVEIYVAPCYAIHDHLEGESDEEKTLDYAQIIFGDDDLLLDPTSHNRLLFMAGYVKEQRVNRILLDGGSAVNILPLQTLKKLDIPTEDLSQSRLMIQGFKQGGQREIGTLRLNLMMDDMSTSAL